MATRPQADWPSSATGQPTAARARRPSPERILERLCQVELLQALPPEEIQAIVPFVDSIEVPQGQRVFSQGDRADALYFIEDGTARVLLENGTDLGGKRAGEVFGEMALLTGEPRSATVRAETDLKLLRISREDFEHVARGSPRLESALRELAERHRAGLALARIGIAERRSWRGTALRALAARRRGIRRWQAVMGFGGILWVLLRANEIGGWIEDPRYELWIAMVQLIAGLTIIDGACEAFILATERTGARLRWNGFTAGTIGSLVSTLPEFFVVAFLVAVEPFAAFVTAAVTIFNNAMIFSLYSFFLPKDDKGRYVMPTSLAKAGGEVLVAGSGIAMIIGVVMIVLKVEGQRTALGAADLLVLSIVFIAIYCYYLFVLIRYYAEGNEQDSPNHPPDPNRLGHDTSLWGIGSMGILGMVGAYMGGDAVGAFADTALHQLHLPTIPTAAALAFFAGISEEVIVWTAHRRGEISIALSSVFGGITQVQTLLLPFCMGVIGVFALATGSDLYGLPINPQTILLMLLQFPMLYVLLEYLREDHTLNNLDAASMTGIYALLLFFLFTASPSG